MNIWLVIYCYLNKCNTVLKHLNIDFVINECLRSSFTSTHAFICIDTGMVKTSVGYLQMSAFTLNYCII